eukprot:GFUD01111322.1.p1 GENE.GFUD01111322.1~~GFUD01111322.1.p1  ORF type:complete len:127 (-),score=6.29 GFUD01111322.1:101-442(-)
MFHNTNFYFPELVFMSSKFFIFRAFNFISQAGFLTGGAPAACSAFKHLPSPRDNISSLSRPGRLFSTSLSLALFLPALVASEVTSFSWLELFTLSVAFDIIMSRLSRGNCPVQ